MSSLLIIGGSDAGTSAALRAREVDANAQITVVLADRFPNYSVCGLPFYESGEVPDWHWLAHRTAEEISGEGISLLLDHKAQSINAKRHEVTVVDTGGQARQLGYDRLVLATGALPVRPHIPGIDLPGVFLLRSMQDSFAVHEYLDTHIPRSAVIVGGGYIGMEMADAFVQRGLAVTVVEHGVSVLKTVDESLGRLVSAELQHHGVEVITDVAIERLVQADKQLYVMGSQEFSTAADLVLVAVGVQPQTGVAQSAGIALGEHHAIRVSRAMETNVPDIFAAGDCVETWHRLLQAPTYLPLGTTAHKQGRIAGENAVGGHREFAGALGTQVVKVFDLVVGRTGLRDGEARDAGFDPLTVESTVWDHKVYYPGAHEIRIRITGDGKTGRLLGAQMVGHYHGEIAKRIDIFATALFHGMRVDDLNDFDLSYTPPVSSPWDPVQMSAQAWVKQCQ
ncbi:MAG TPA: FAD-dependent oxidoreductase [Ktedonobacteraceae bacterium]|nr:FAD-dependent oxidoreductase [Ktedonobacteraceae bacterium]